MVGLKNIRKQQNLNQQKVAMDLNISREALSYYENGKREPSLALFVLRYNLRQFTDTNSVICKMIVGDGSPVPICAYR